MKNMKTFSIKVNGYLHCLYWNETLYLDPGEYTRIRHSHMPEPGRMVMTLFQTSRRNGWAEKWEEVKFNAENFDLDSIEEVS